jgi:AraC-like DNA-binding protein
MSVLYDSVRFEQLFITNESKSPRVYVTNDLRIVYVQKGKAKWKIAGKTFPVKSGDLVLMSNKNPRILTYIDSEDPLSLYVLNICPQALFQFGMMQLFTDIPRDISPVLTTGNDEIIGLYHRIKAEHDNALLHSPIVISATTVTILALLARRYHLAVRPGAIAPNIKTVLDYIDANYCEKLSLSCLAHMAGMCRESFSKQFKRCIGIPFSQYIRHKRIAKAISLIETTESTILSIALDCGFETMANFYKAFHALTGKTPSDYRKSSLSSQVHPFTEPIITPFTKYFCTKG